MFGRGGISVFSSTSIQQHPIVFNIHPSSQHKCSGQDRHTPSRKRLSQPGDPTRTNPPVSRTSRHLATFCWQFLRDTFPASEDNGDRSETQHASTLHDDAFKLWWTKLSYPVCHLVVQVVIRGMLRIPRLLHPGGGRTDSGVRRRARADGAWKKQARRKGEAAEERARMRGLTDFKNRNKSEKWKWKWNLLKISH